MLEGLQYALLGGLLGVGCILYQCKSRGEYAPFVGLNQVIEAFVFAREDSSNQLPFALFIGHKSMENRRLVFGHRKWMKKPVKSCRIGRHRSAPNPGELTFI